MKISDPFLTPRKRPHVHEDTFSRDEVRLANRNHGAMLELMANDITPTGAHYLLTHFDVPVIDPVQHRLRFHGAFSNPYELTMDDILAMKQVTMPVTLECAGNGRTAGLIPRSCSMPWAYEAVGTSAWTGTPLWPLIERARPQTDAVEISFTGLDVGYDKGERHAFGRSLTMQQVADLEVLLVTGMNGQPLLPQHGAPLRIVVPGWYGMASVKWLADIEALTQPYQGFQQVQTYRFRQDEDDPGRPVTNIRVKSLMVPPGVPDWLTRTRQASAGPVEIMGRAWSGAGTSISKVEFNAGGQWIEADLEPSKDRYAWSKWHVVWDATPGEHVLRCRATDAEGNTQPIEPQWDMAGFANNVCQEVPVFVQR